MSSERTTDHPLDPARSRWRRTLACALALVAARIAVMAAFRRHDPAVLDAVRWFNKRWLNPAMLELAGRRHWYAARLEHVGRRSGRRYATPVVVRRIGGTAAVPLPYGTRVDWLRNVQEAGGADLVAYGDRYVLTAPRIAPTSSVAAGVSPLVRQLCRLYGIREWLVLDAQPTTAALAAAPPAAISGTPT